MGINTDNLGMGLSAILKGVYQVRAIGSGATLPPSVFTHTVPANMTVGKSYQVAFSGVTSAKGAVTYTLSSPANLGSMLGFSKSTGILADEDITVSVHADTGGGTHSTAVPGNYSLEVRAYAGQTLVSTHTVDFTLVAAVLTGTIAVSGASGTTTAGGSATFRFSGVTADTGTVTYSIANSGQSYFTFSKSTNIAANEAITVTAAANTPTGSYNFTISANTSPSASNGPVTASCSQSVTAAVVTPTLSGSISHNIPSTVTAASNYGVKFGGKSATSGTVLYNVNINSGSQYGTFTKTSGIAAGETIYLSVASNAPNGGSISGTISANTSPVGASNGPDSVSFSTGTLAIVEPDPTFSGLNHTVPTNTKQGQSYTVTFSGTSSSNGRPVWYSLSPQTGLSFSKLDKISSGEAVTLTIGGSASGTLAVTVYANTTKNDGSTFTRSVANIQTVVAVPAPVLTGTIRIEDVPNMMTAGSSATYRFSGVTADTGTVTYSISNRDQSYFTFSKSTNLAANEAFTVTSAANTPTGIHSFNVSANTSPSASNGPRTGFTTQSVTAVTPTLSGTIQANFPSSTTLGSSGTVTLSGVTSNTGTVTYSIAERALDEQSRRFTFSKTSGIKAGEPVSWSIPYGKHTGGAAFLISANTSPTASNGPMTDTFYTYVT